MHVGQYIERNFLVVKFQNAHVLLVVFLNDEPVCVDFSKVREELLHGMDIAGFLLQV